jgi:hypothetical protein
MFIASSVSVLVRGLQKKQNRANRVCV